jgi:peptidoglycan hydrolase-like protein with peptidoglycan-binding domain
MISTKRTPALNATGAQVSKAQTGTVKALAISPKRLAAVSLPVLRVGDFGAEVERAQALLSKQGFDPKGADGQFGPNTRAAVVAFQRAKGLSADGVIGPQTWKALQAGVVDGPGPVGSGGLNAPLLAAAQGEVGNVERTNDNDGVILKYPNAFGRGSESWCADFTSWCSKQAGGAMNECYCPTLVNSLKQKGLWKGKADPKPGDLVLFDWDGDGEADHVGVVEKVNGDGTISTIEGNSTNQDTGKEGVFRQERDRSQVLGFGTPY